MVPMDVQLGQPFRKCSMLRIIPAENARFNSIHSPHACRLERKRKRAEEKAALKAEKEAEERRQRKLALLERGLGFGDDFAPAARPGEAGGPCPDGARWCSD